MAEIERINPIRITDKNSGEVYELDFNRDAIQFAEQNGFKLEDLANFPGTKPREFFYYAFRYHHKRLSRGQTDKLYEKMGGVTGKMLERLIDLYNQAVAANNIQDEEELAENPFVEVEM